MFNCLSEEGTPLQMILSHVAYLWHKWIMYVCVSAVSQTIVDFVLSNYAKVLAITSPFGFVLFI